MNSRLENMTHSPAKIGIGGDFALDWHALWESSETPSLFATGRDALASVVKSKPATGAVWLAPDFICPVVPDTLRACGVQVQPYEWLTPWQVNERNLKGLLASAAGIVVPFYMGLAPAPEIWDLLNNRALCVVEDRCQCVGPPPSPDILRGDYAVGSYRKWLPVPDGAYCIARDGSMLKPDCHPNYKMVRLRLAAALVKQTRLSGVSTEMDGNLEKIGIELFQMGEDMAGGTAGGRYASAIAESIVRDADYRSISRGRMRNQAWLAEQLACKSSVKIFEPEVGAITRSDVPLLALPLLCAQRDRIRARLTDQKVFCPIHWRDGDWSNKGERPAAWAASEFSLPIDQRYELVDFRRIVEVIE